MKHMILSAIIYCIAACNNDKEPTAFSEKHDFFPVNSFLKEQVHEVDSLKLPVYKYTTINNKTDSVLISNETFHTLAKQFMEPDINDPAFKKFYKETSFADQSIPNITFTYSTGNKDLVLQRMDVIINPDPVLNDQVKSIYLEKNVINKDTSVLTKLYWRAGKNFLIISSKQTIGKPAIFSQLKVTWDTTN